MRIRAHQLHTSAPRLFSLTVAALAALGALIVVPARALRAGNAAHALKSASAPATLSNASLTGQKYELRLHHLHTGENIDVVYRIGNTYIPSAIDRLNHFLRDHRTQDTAHYDPKEFDTLHALLARLGKPSDVIDVVCGYRTPWSNNFLRTRGGTAAPSQTGVAQHSQHMLSKAIDLRIPGFSTLQIRNAALSLHAGGVGYYPVSQFVHVDVGPVRQWTFAGAGKEG